ncbi:hypothetical protein FBU31_007385 [Coemansia sp. 'formosensis']|nr:hypothetical protein FBU31_007385 [Coemansia sp. 'formosensis']
MGMLWGSQLVGRASLPLSALRTKAEAAALLEIKPGSDALGRTSKPLPGGPVFIDLAARLRLPLSNKPESESHVERWIYVQSQEEEQQQQQQRYEPINVISQAQPAAASEPEKLGAPQEPATAQPSIERATTDATQTDSEAETQAKEEPPSSNRQPPQDESGTDDIAIMLDTIDGLFSNATLELELAQLPVRLSEARDKDAANQIRELEAAIELRMSVIAAQVGAGLLSIQDYMDNVSAELAQAKEWALAANRSARKDLALRALKRVKAMQGELSDMKAAMDAESD